MSLYTMDTYKISFTIDEACSATGLSRNSIYKLIRDGKLKPSLLCGRKLIAREQLVKVVADSEGKPTPAVGRGHNAHSAIAARWHGRKTAVTVKRRVAK